MAGIATYTFPSCVGGASYSSALPDLSTATSMQITGSSTCSAYSNIGGGYLTYSCGTWGTLQTYYTDATCTTVTRTVVAYSQDGCSYRQGQVCLTPSALPLALVPTKMCKGSTLPSPLPVSGTLNCMMGTVTNTGSSSSLLSFSTSSDYSMCYSATLNCTRIPKPYSCDSNTSSVREYGGVNKRYEQLANVLSRHVQDSMTDISYCTTDKCNALSSDTCAISSPPYTTLACSVTAPPNPINAPAPIACYSNIPDGGPPQLQTAPVNNTLDCVAFTVNCIALNKTWRTFSFNDQALPLKLLKACGANSVFRAYSGA
jgi:hypothetical protein